MGKIGSERRRVGRERKGDGEKRGDKKRKRREEKEYETSSWTDKGGKGERKK